MARKVVETEALPVKQPRPIGVLARQPLIASGQMIDLTTQGGASVYKRLQLPWQFEAWRYTKQIGELWYADTLVSGQGSKARIIPATVDDGSEPKPLEVDGDQGDAAAPDPRGPIVHGIMQILRPGGDFSDLVRNYFWNIDVAGECWLINPVVNGIIPAGVPPWVQDRFDIYSIEEVEVTTAGNLKIKLFPGDTQGYELPPEAFSARLWQNDPAFRNLADSPMRAVLGICEELLMLGMGIRASAVARIPAGLLLVPDGLSFIGQEDDPDQGDEGQVLLDPFVQELLAGMTTPVSDPSSAASLVPNVIRGNATDLKELRHLLLDRPMDETSIRLRAELLTRLANGLDLPADALSGTDTLNHWSAWLLDEQTYKNHIEPKLIAFCRAMTQAFLKPMISMLSELNPGVSLPDGLENVVLWFDPSGITNRPDLSANAIALYGVYAISQATLLRSAGFDPDADAPDDDELAKRVALAQALAGPAATPGDMPVNAGNVKKDVPSTPGALALITPRALTASSRPNLATLGHRLQAIDHARTMQLGAAGDAAVMRVLEKAGAKFRRSQQGKSLAIRKAIDGVPNQSVFAALTAAGIQLDQEAPGIDPFEFDPLQASWNQWVGSAQAKRLAILTAEIDADQRQVDDVQAADDRNRAAGWLVLAAGLAAVASNNFTHQGGGIDQPGEYTPGVTVPQTIISGALSRAGGSDGKIGPTGIMLVPNTGLNTPAGVTGDQTLVPAPGLSAGITARELLKAANIVQTSWTWSTGDPSRPFEPHDSLNGTEFQHWDDDALSNGSGWPDGDYYFPGDHLGCFPGGTIVSGEKPRGSTLRRYEGEMVELAFASGQLLTATPNHPVLTKRGWVGAGLLNETDEVVRCLPGQPIPGLVPHDRQMPALIEEVAASVGVPLGMGARGVPVTAEDFHGDGAGSEVAVVRSDRLLRHRFDPTLAQPLAQYLLALRYERAALLAGDSRTAERFERVGRAALRHVSSLSLSAPVLGSQSAVPQRLRSRHATKDNTRPGQSPTQGSATHADRLGESLEGLAGFVSFDQVREVRRFPFGGHVYNLHTPASWYIANGVIVHNCQCTADSNFGTTESADDTE